VIRRSLALASAPFRQRTKSESATRSQRPCCSFDDAAGHGVDAFSVPTCGRHAQFKVFGMPGYWFKFYDPNSRSEKLGAAVLADDDEAVAFARRVIRELIGSDEKHATWRVEITARERKVASMPFASAATSE
jgi:hypothetical protein